jgi:catechol 2,3-dioxygenase
MTGTEHVSGVGAAGRGSTDSALNARLSHVSLGTANISAGREFYEDHVGLTVIERLAENGIRMGLGAGPHVLELTEGNGLDHFALELAGEAEINEVVVRLQSHGIETHRQDGAGDHPHSVTFADPDGNRIELHGRTNRGGTARGGNGRRPMGMHHITLSSENVPKLADFYVSVLGFRVSDHMEDRFVWLRCNHEHHTVAIVEGEARGLDHYCYEVADWNELKSWCDELAAGGITVTWGPGRHGPGNNLFVFFDDRDGVHIELSCEMERFWDEVVAYGPPRCWAPGTNAVNLWGPAPLWRRQLGERV